MNRNLRSLLVGQGVTSLYRSERRYRGVPYGSALTELRILDCVVNTNGSVTSHNILLPDPIHPGEMILAAVNIQDDAANGHPNGWNVINSTDGGLNGLATYWKIANGTEGGTSIVSTSAASRVSACCAVRIGGFNGAAPVVTTASSGAGSTSRDMPSHVAPNARNALVVLVIGIGGGSASINPTAWPAGYTYVTAAAARESGGNDAGIAIGAKQNVTGAEDPGNFTYSAGVGYVGQTIIIKG